MGLFDPPAVSIRKRVPKDVHGFLDELEATVNEMLSPLLNGTKRGMIVAYVQAAWVLGGYRQGALVMDQKSASYVSNMGLNCHRMLGETAKSADEIVDVMIAGGIIPAPPE